MLLLVAGNGLHHGWSLVTDQQKWQNLETHIFKFWIWWSARRLNEGVADRHPLYTIMNKTASP